MNLAAQGGLVTSTRDFWSKSWASLNLPWSSGLTGPSPGLPGQCLPQIETTGVTVVHSETSCGKFFPSKAVVHVLRRTWRQIMSLFKKNPDPITDPSRELNAKISDRKGGSVKTEGCRNGLGDLTQGSQQTFRVNGMNWRKVGFVKRQKQGIGVYVQQVPVGGHQQWDLLHGSFGQNQTVVKLVFGNQALSEQILVRSGSKRRKLWVTRSLHKAAILAIVNSATNEGADEKGYLSTFRHAERSPPHPARGKKPQPERRNRHPSNHQTWEHVRRWRVEAVDAPFPRAARLRQEFGRLLVSCLEYTQTEGIEQEPGHEKRGLWTRTAKAER